MKTTLTSGQPRSDHHMQVTPTGTAQKMPNYPRPPQTPNRPRAMMHAVPPPPPLYLPNTPSAASLAQGTGTTLTVTWTTPAVDGTHGAAAGFNLRSSPSGAGAWTNVPGVTSPYNLSGLAAGAAIDVQIQSSNATGTSAWSATSTLTTAIPAPFAPNAPSAASLAQGAGSALTVTWTAPAI